MRELARLERFRRDFIADFSHEMKTPLAGIIGALDLLGDDPAEENRRKLVSLAGASARRLDALARGVLDLARLERAEAPSGAAECDIAEVVREAVDEQSAAAEAAGVELRVSAPEGGVRAFAERDLLRAAVSNLVANAILHSGSPVVAASAGLSGGKVRIVVEDRGRGISREDAARIFERFYRADRSRSAASGGAGLGLSIVRRTARLHGGDATFAPVRGGGASFTIEFPARGKRIS